MRAHPDRSERDRYLIALRRMRVSWSLEQQIATGVAWASLSNEDAAWIATMCSWHGSGSGARALAISLLRALGDAVRTDPRSKLRVPRAAPRYDPLSDAIIVGQIASSVPSRIVAVVPEPTLTDVEASAALYDRWVRGRMVSQ